jgi:glycosyltransferase involved in cell wall biosynthesis
MSKPHVSVLVDTYNHEQLIELAITTVLQQGMSMLDVKTLVMDDVSTDDMPEKTSFCR